MTCSTDVVQPAKATVCATLSGRAGAVALRQPGAAVDRALIRRTDISVAWQVYYGICSEKLASQLRRNESQRKRGLDERSGLASVAFFEESCHQPGRVAVGPGCPTR